jgi:hypothetical protein
MDFRNIRVLPGPTIEDVVLNSNVASITVKVHLTGICFFNNNETA